MSTLKRHEGYLMVDHRASPGLDKPGMGEGSIFEAPTLGCAHCATVVVMNPNRKRARAYCAKCDRYICDNCAVVAVMPEYQHRSWQELVDMVTSGRFTIVGGTDSAPIVVPTGGQHG